MPENVSKDFAINDVSGFLLLAYAAAAGLFPGYYLSYVADFLIDISNDVHQRMLWLLGMFSYH